MENLNIALSGCGMIGREHIERIQNRIRNARISRYSVCAFLIFEVRLIIHPRSRERNREF